MLVGLVRLVGNVEIDLLTARLVGMKNTEGWSVDVQGNQILAAHVGVAELMYVRYV